MGIQVQLFNTPTVLKDKRKILFPFRKAEALFYYLLVNRQASRDELVNLLWGEMDDETAKKNLRNALYKINKTLGEDILVSPKKSVVILNDHVQMNIDVDAFLKSRQDGLAVYTGPFLKGFSVKQGEAFEDWLLLKRAQYQDLYVKMLYREIEENSGNSLPVDQLALRLVEADEFDERAYRILMRHYADSGHYNKAVELYEKLCMMLEEELGVQPETATIALHQEIISNRNKIYQSVKEERDTFFFGRREELSLLSSAFAAYRESGETRAVLILGEAGIGKTRLKDYFFRNIKSSHCLLEANCYQAEEEFLLKPWYPIFSQLADLLNQEGIELPQLWVEGIASLFPSFALVNSCPTVHYGQDSNFSYQSSVDAIMGMLSVICKKKQLVLIFEDMQWMDSMSKQLLQSILFAKSGIRIFFAATCRSGYESRFEGWLAPLVKEDRLEKIQLQRFTLDEARDFARMYLPDLHMEQKQFKKIYNDTEGNTFFLVEYLNNVRNKNMHGEKSAKLLDILKSRFVDVSAEGMKLLNLLSLFFHRVPVDLLTDITGKDPMEITDILEELQLKGIIREVVQPDKVSLEFTHQKLREFIYSRQSGFKKRLLHDKVAQVMEKRLRNDYRDMHQYSKLIHHYTEAGNRAKALRYHLKNLTVYLDYCHELFPEIIDAPNRREKKFSIRDDQLQRYFRQVELLLHDLEASDSKMVEDWMTYLHIRGRHLIRQGDYAEGVSLIHRMLELAKEQGSCEFILKGYLQLIYRCIQTHSVEEMRVHLDDARQVNEQSPRFETTGTLYRLSGLCAMMSGEQQIAEDSFRQSIAFFSENNKTKDKYALTIAACYNYLGEIRRLQQAFSDALPYYERALQICEEQKMYESFSFFSTCAGQAALAMGEKALASVYLKQAVDYYETSDLAWRRSVAEAYFSLLLVEKNQYVDAYKHLETAERYAEKMKNPYESGMVCLVKAKIRALMMENKELACVFQNKLDEDVRFYCQQGLRFLQPVYCYEGKILQNLLEDHV